MILFADIGNSAIKWATSVDLPNMNSLDAEHYVRSQFSDVLESRWHNMVAPQHLMVSNVAGQEIEEALTHWSRNHWQVKPEFVYVKDNTCEVKLAYQDISQFGVDRWLAVIAAWKKMGNALCIVDCGTSITIDGVSDTGCHLGGMILPGIHLMQQSLVEHAQGISGIENIQGKSEFADNTQQGVASGSTMAVVSLVDRLVNDMQAEYGNEVSCVITGGGAQQVLQLLELDFEFDPHLVLQGLAWVAKERL